MEGAKQQRLQGKKEISKKLETECNQLKQENTKFQHQRQQDTDQFQKLCKKTHDLQEGLSAEQIIYENQKKVTDLENEVDGLKVTVGKKEHVIKSLREENDDFLTRQWQRATEENAELRCTIERYKEQIADMSKQLGLHKQEKAYISSMAISMLTWITDINKGGKNINSSKLSRPQNMSLDSFVQNMEFILNRVTDMKNEMITTEQNLAAKIGHVAKWTDEQKKIEDGLQREIQDKAKTIRDQDEKFKIQLSRIQELTSAFEDVKNENNKLKQQIFDNQKKAAQHQSHQSHKLVVENGELRRRLTHMNTDLQQRAEHIESLQRAMQKDEQIQDIKRDADDLRTKLSSMAGDKLTKGNPDITDLGDPNRPMKIAEKYGELYDNEWTDAMDYPDVDMRVLFPAVDHPPFYEILVYHLHRLLMCCYRECLKLSTEQEQTIRSAVINPMKLQIDEDGTDVNNMPGYREIVNVRRQNAQQFANTLFQNKIISMTSIITDWDYIYKHEELIEQLLETPFFEKCVHLCWYMVIQDPVMYLTEEIKPDTVYNRDVYKEFVQSGDKVKYAVWPALFLHEGGPLLYKGVVQAYK